MRTSLQFSTMSEHMDERDLAETLLRNHLLAALAITICLASCAKRDERASSISEIIHERATLEGKRILVRGYIEVDALDAVNFIEQPGPPEGDRITESIDLVPRDDQLTKKAAKLNGACVVVDGVFRLYAPGHLFPVSGLNSKYGLVDATAIHKCAAE